MTKSEGPRVVVGFAHPKFATNRYRTVVHHEKPYKIGDVPVTLLSRHSQGVGPLEGWMRGWSRERIRPPWAHENIGAAELNDMVADAISEILGEKK